MASVSLGAVAQRRELPANPWIWIGLGGGLTLASCIWTQIFGVDASDNRVILLALGLLGTGAGVNLRWNDRQTLYIGPRAPALARIARLLLALVMGSTALAITVLLGLAIFDTGKTAWNPGATSLVWLTFAPVSLLAAMRCVKRTPGQAELDVTEEIGLSLAGAAFFCFLGSMTLNLGGDFATDWDTIRLCLRVMVAICLFGSAIVLVTTCMRRLVMSLVIFLHFAGIATASLSAPPSPWLVLQLWTRVFRPYLEFMYLNNAYHFYAPDPGPANYIWFRLIYTAPDGRDYGWWYKAPELDEKGNSTHTVTMEYLRFLCLTESASKVDSPPPAVYTDANGELDTPEIYKVRMQLGMPANKKDKVLFAAQNKFPRIPLDPALGHMQQVSIPNDTSRRLLASYARFVAHNYAEHPENPSWKFKSVKVYRVIHKIAPSMALGNGVPPSDPELYTPFYLGNYDSEGALIQDNDPYLYWLLPIMRTNRNDPGAKIRDFARLHAGDPNWVRPPLQFRSLSDPPPWGEPDEEDRNLVAP